MIRDKVINPDTNNGWHLSLPLHLLVRLEDFHLVTPVSKEADWLRLFLKLYPEAAGIKDGEGKTPYGYVILKNCSPFVQRLLLHADRTIDPINLHRLNYSERRFAVFLAFKAIIVSTELTIFTRLRAEDKSLLRHVVSFL